MVTSLPHVVVATAADAQAWDEYIHAHRDATADHLWRWQDIFTGVFGHDSAYLMARRDDRVVGVLPLVLFNSRVFGRCAVSVPFLNYGGVLASDPAASAALVAAATDRARAFAASHIEFRHTARMLPDLPVRQHKLGLSRALPATSDALWTGLDRKVRNQVRKAQKEQLETQTGGAELVDAFYPIFAENMRDLGTPVYAKRLFSETLRLFPDRATVTVVRHRGRVIAGAIAVRFRETVLVPWASALREFRPLCANMLLYWTLLEHAIATGATRFDFGRSSPDAGTHQFKLQWGATEAPLHWEYVLISRKTAPDQGPANPKFLAAVEMWKHLPLWAANALGPHIVRSIP